MATTSPARIEDDLYASAKLAGEALDRSASQQIAHWARIGREIQASATISHREIADVLAGRSCYDELNPKEQAVVRAEWAERMAVYRDGIDLTARFVAEGRTWVELDDDGRVVERGGAIESRPGRAMKKAPAKRVAKKPLPTTKAAKNAASRTATAKRSARARAAS